MTLLAAYLLWRMARRLVPLVLLAGLALVLLSPRGHLPTSAGQLRYTVQGEIRDAQQALARTLETHLRRR